MSILYIKFDVMFNQIKFTTMKKEQIKINKIVHFEDDEIMVLDYLFEYADGMKGATGTRFYPVSKEQHEERTSVEYMAEYFKDAGLELETDQSYIGIANNVLDEGSETETMFDTSFSELWDYLRSELNLDENEAYIFECTGGGRMFDKNFEGNKSKLFSKLIRSYES